jgi:squalene synthase HpnC
MASPALRKRENFPVASSVLPRHAREGIRAFYDFCRGADDVADCPITPGEEKQATLARVHQALRYGTARQELPAWAAPYCRIASQRGLPLAHAEKLLEALMLDTWKQHYATEQELVDYSLYSAASVGRGVLDLCGEHHADREASDALCCALQILNHLQDARDDYVMLKRVYLPVEWLMEAGATPEMLAGPKMSPSLTPVFARGLDLADRLLQRAEAFPASLRSRRVQFEAATALAWAKRLSRRLRKRDPVAVRVTLGPLSRLLGVMEALGQTGQRMARETRDRYRRTLGACRSSFFIPMLMLPQVQRDSLLALHEFCRSADACADDPSLPKKEATLRMRLLKNDIEAIYAHRATSFTALKRAIDEYDIPRECFESLFAGIGMDMEEEMYKPPMAKLTLYCQRVASSVGIMTLCVLEADRDRCRDFALHLGVAMQLTNILRDTWEDRQRDRIYFPAEWIDAVETADAVGEPIFENPAVMGSLCRAMADMAREHYDAALHALPASERSKVTAVLAMRSLYLALLTRMEQEGWPALRRKTPARFSLWSALRMTLKVKDVEHDNAAHPDASRDEWRAA